MSRFLEDLPQVCVTPTGYATKRSREMVTLSGLPSLGPMYVHDNDTSNIVWSVHERVLGTTTNGTWHPTMQPEAGSFEGSLAAFRRRVGQRVGANALPITTEQFVGQYGGPKAKRYAAASESLRLKAVTRADSYPGVFLKGEKWHEDKPGRIISARHPRYLLEVGKYICPIEHALYKAVDEVYGAPTIMKGYTPERRAAIVRSHWNSFADPVAVGQDFSKFDQHISRSALEYEHGFYLAAYSGDSTLQRLLSWQLETTCYANARDGRVKYRVSGGRMSGDMNTALGNCLISSALLWAYTHEAGVKVKAIVDGDDSVAFMERTDLARYLSGIKDWMAKRGFKLVTEEPVTDIARVEFCQCRFVAASPATMVRNPVKAVTQDHAWIVDASLTHREVLAATGLGGLSLYGNIPVLGAYYNMLAGATALSRRTRRRITFQSTWLRDAQLTGGTFAEPTEEARYALWEAWGITPGEQRELEAKFNATDLSQIDRLDTYKNLNRAHVQEYYTIATNNN